MNCQRQFVAAHSSEPAIAAPIVLGLMLPAANAELLSVEVVMFVVRFELIAATY